MVKIISLVSLGFLILNFSLNVNATGLSISDDKIDSGSSNRANIPHHRTKRTYALLVPREDVESSEEHHKSKRCWRTRPVQKVKLSSLYPEDSDDNAINDLYDNQKRSVENYWDSDEVGEETVRKLKLVPINNPRNNLKDFLRHEESEEFDEDVLRKIKNHLKSDDYKVLALVGKRSKNSPSNNRRKLICYCRDANCAGGDCDRMMYRPCSVCRNPVINLPGRLNTKWYSNYGREDERVPLNVRYPDTRNQFIDYSMHGADYLQEKKSRKSNNRDFGIPENSQQFFHESPRTVQNERIFKVPVSSKAPIENGGFGYSSAPARPLVNLEKSQQFFHESPRIVPNERIFKVPVSSKALIENGGFGYSSAPARPLVNLEKSQQQFFHESPRRIVPNNPNDRIFKVPSVSSKAPIENGVSGYSSFPVRPLVNQYRPGNVRFISTDPRWAMNQYHAAIGNSGVISPSYHQGNVRFHPPGSQSYQYLGTPQPRVTTGHQGSSNNVFYAGHQGGWETRPVQHFRVPSRRIEYPRTTQASVTLTSLKDAEKDNYDGFPETVTHYDTSTEHSLRSYDVYSDESIAKGHLNEQKNLDYTGVSDEPSKYKFPVVFTDNVGIAKDNKIPETLDRSTTLESQEFYTVPDIVGSKQKTTHDRSNWDKNIERTTLISSAEDFGSDELKVSTESEDVLEHDQRSTTEDYSDIRVITNGYFSSEAFNDLEKVDEDVGSVHKTYENTDHTYSSNSAETVETQMESGLRNENDDTPNSGDEIKDGPIDFSVVDETSINHENDNLKNIVDTQINKDDEIVSKVEEREDDTHDDIVIDGTTNSSGDSESLESVASREPIVSNSSAKGTPSDEIIDLSSRRMPSEEIFESHENQKSSEDREASIERVGDHHADSEDYESLSPEEKSVYTTYEVEDDDQTLSVSNNVDDVSEKLLKKHVDHDQESFELYSPGAPVRTCSVGDAFNPVIEYMPKEFKVPVGKSNGEYLTLVDNEPVAIDNSATKYFSPNDRVLEYIKKHSQNLVRDSEDHRSTEMPELYHTKSVLEYPESDYESVFREEILERPFDSDEESRARTESSRESLSEEESQDENHDKQSQIAEDSSIPDINVKVSRNQEGSDYTQYSSNQDYDDQSSPEIDLINHYEDEDRSSEELLLTSGLEENKAKSDSGHLILQDSMDTESHRQDEDLVEIQHLNNFSSETTETVEDQRESTSRSSEEDHSVDETMKKSIPEDSLVLENPQRLNEDFDNENVGIIHVQEKLLHHDYNEESRTDYSTEKSYTDEYSHEDHNEEMITGRSTNCKSREKVKPTTQSYSVDSTSEEDEDRPNIQEAEMATIESKENSLVLENPQRLNEDFDHENVGIIHVQKKPLHHHNEYMDYTEESRTDYSTEKSYTDEYGHADHDEETINGRSTNCKSRDEVKPTTQSYSIDSTSEEEVDRPNIHEIESKEDYSISKSKIKTLERINGDENTLSEDLNRYLGLQNTEHYVTDDVLQHRVQTSSNSPEEVGSWSDEDVEDHDLRKSSESTTKYENTHDSSSTLERINGNENTLSEDLNRYLGLQNTEHYVTDDVLQHRVQTSSNSLEEVESWSDEDAEDHNLQKSSESTTKHDLSSTSLKIDQNLEEMKSVEFVGGPQSTGDCCTRPPEVGDDAGYLGRLAPKNPNAVIRSVGELVNSDLYYIGDGVRLPLTIKKLKDGSFALSISDKICEKRSGDKCPCCVPREGKILEEKRNDESGVHRRALPDGTEHHKRSTRSITMPVDEFVEKYNLILDLDDHESSLIHNVIQRDDKEQEFGEYNSDLVQRLKTIKDLPDDERASVLLSALKELVRTEGSNVLDEELRSLKSRDEEDGTLGFRYGYQRDNPILDRIEMIKKLREKMYECEHKYQKDCDIAVTQKTELLTMILYWIKDIISDT